MIDEKLYLPYTSSEEQIKLPEAFKSGFYLDGWYADSKFNKEVKINSTMPNLEQFNLKSEGVAGYSTTIYAKWEKESCPVITGNNLKISFDTKGIVDIEDISICTTCSEEKVTLPTPTKKGYLFAGWYNDSKFTDVVNIESNLSPDINKLYIINESDSNGCSTNSSKTTLYARWFYYLEENVTIKYMDNEEIEKITYNNKNYNKLFTPEKDGYKFIGWYLIKNIIIK